MLLLRSSCRVSGVSDPYSRKLDLTRRLATFTRRIQGGLLSSSTSWSPCDRSLKGGFSVSSSHIRSHRATCP